MHKISNQKNTTPIYKKTRRLPFTENASDLSPEPWVLKQEIRSRILILPTRDIRLQALIILEPKLHQPLTRRQIVIPKSHILLIASKLSSNLPSNLPTSIALHSLPLPLPLPHPLPLAPIPPKH